MSLEDELNEFRENCVEVVCSRCGSSTGIIRLPWGPEGQRIVCDDCSGRPSPSPCPLCEGTGQVYIPSFAVSVNASDVRTGRSHLHSFPNKVYWQATVCLCEFGHKFRVKSVNDDDGSIIYVSHQDNPSTQTFLERGFQEEETRSFRQVQEQKKEKQEAEEPAEIDW